MIPNACWLSNLWLGQGIDFDYAKRPIKQKISVEQVIVKLQCVASDSAILSADGKITVWKHSRNSGNSCRVISLQQKVVVSMGLEFMLILTVDNRLYAFGENHQGQCGQGSISWPIEQPVEVKNLHNLRIKQISAGYHHCLIKCTKVRSDTPESL